MKNQIVRRIVLFGGALALSLASGAVAIIHPSLIAAIPLIAYGLNDKSYILLFAVFGILHYLVGLIVMWGTLPRVMPISHKENTLARISLWLGIYVIYVMFLTLWPAFHGISLSFGGSRP
jgi:hypothetical protein